MRKFLFPIIMMAFCLTCCQTTTPSKSETSSDSSQTSESSSTSSSSEDSSSSSDEKPIGIPAFSQTAYSYDKNVLCDLELPVELNGVNIYASYMNDYLLSFKQSYYNPEHKVLVITEDYMVTLDKGNYTLTVYFDEEIDPAVLTITVMNSVETSFDTTLKNYAFGKTGDLRYECDFSTATVKSLKKGDVVIPSSYYYMDNGDFVLKKELLERTYGTSEFTLTLSNNDTYTFNVNTDIMFFTDYDITTIHSEVESIYGANPLYQYASSDHVMIVDASEYGMNGRALKYIPNTIPVELDCNSIFTLADVTTSMSWYKVGYVASKTYVISFDYETIGSSDIAGQTFVFATITNWGAPFSFSQNLLMGPSNDGKVHHFSIILTGSQIQSGTFIYAKWLGGSGFLLVDNFKVCEINEGFDVSTVPSYKQGTGDFTMSLNSHGWDYTVEIDGTPIADASCGTASLTIPEASLNSFAVGAHELSFNTAIGYFTYPFIIKEDGVCVLNETTKTFSDSSSQLKLSGEFVNCSIMSAKKYGAIEYDISKTNGQTVDISGFELVSDGLIVKPVVLQYLYGGTRFELEFTTGETLEFTLTSTTMTMFTNFNETDVWCWSYNGTPSNITICQDTGMTSLQMVDGRKVLVYQPKDATLDHAKNPGTHQNGILTFKRSTAASNGTYWVPLTMNATKNYQFTLKYEISGYNSNTHLVFYRWLTSGGDDRTIYLDPEQTTWTYTCKAGDILGFYFYCLYSATSDVANYKVMISEFSVEVVS